MKKIAAFGVSRTRDKKGAIIKQTPLPWVNCIHANVGGGWKTMEVLILEVYESEDDSEGRRSGQDSLEHKGYSVYGPVESDERQNPTGTGDL